MWKRIFSLRQILAWNLALLALLELPAGFVAWQHEIARKQCEAKCVNPDSSHVAPANHVEKCQECEANAEWHFPGWYRAFGWPDGVTAWALIFTLIAIAAQTKATAISAEAARISAKAAARGIEIQEKGQRAWLVIRSAMKDYEPSIADKQLRFWWAIKNRGHLPAQILETQCSYELVDPELLYPPDDSIPVDPKPIDMKGFLIAPNETQKYYTILWRNGKVVKPPLAEKDVKQIREDTLHLRVYGYVKYIDGLGAERESRFIEYYVWPLPGRPPRAIGFRALIGAPPDYTKCT